MTNPKITLRTLRRRFGLSFYALANETRVHHSVLISIYNATRVAEPPDGLAERLQQLLDERTRASH